MRLFFIHSMVQKYDIFLTWQNLFTKVSSDRFQTKTQLMIAKIDKTFDTASQSRFFFLDVG